MELLKMEFLGNAYLRWAGALLLSALVYTLLVMLRRVLIRQLGRLARHTDTGADDLVLRLLDRTTRKPLLFILSLYAGTLLLELPAGWERVLLDIAMVAAALQLAMWGNGIIDFLISRKALKESGGDSVSLSAYSAISWLARSAVWAVVILLTLHNLGIEVTALVAGLGVSGIAVALAVQNILGDLFASLSIVLDKPFVIGDFIIVGELAGTVEHVGIKTTRVRSLTGEQIVFSNNDLLGSRIRNYRRMQERRVVFTLGFTYQTPNEKLALLPGIIREAVEAQDKTRFDRAHFKSFGPFSLDFEVVYYVLDREYAAYMDVQQGINLELNRRIKEMGVEFAYPTSTVYLEGDGDGGEAQLRE